LIGGAVQVLSSMMISLADVLAFEEFTVELFCELYDGFVKDRVLLLYVNDVLCPQLTKQDPEWLTVARS